MIIEYNGKANFSIKSKSKTVKIGQKISLGDLEILTPGEYESDGVQVDVIDGTIEICSERITVAWIKKAKVLSDEELEKLDGINILLIGVGGGEFTETRTALDVVRQIEPQIVIPMYAESPDEFLKAEGSKVEPQSQLKINYQELMGEETRVVVLSSV